jgi:glycyl-tRNA synthetase
VVETSVGADRTALVALVDAYHEEEVEGETRVVLRLSPAVAPIKVAVLPLVKKDGLPEIADRIYHDVRKRLTAFYDDGGSIGRRYRRQDEAGTPFCVTVDGQTKDDLTVTVRHRDTLVQDRVDSSRLVAWLEERVLK